MSLESDAGSVPVIALLSKYLRSPPIAHGRRPTWRTRACAQGRAGYIDARLYSRPAAPP